MSGIKWVFCMMHYCVNIDRCALSGGVVSYLRIDWPAAAPAKLREAPPSAIKTFFPGNKSRPPSPGSTDDIIRPQRETQKNAVCVTFSKIH